MSEFIDLSKIPKKQQTEDLCIAAVSQYGYNLQYVKNQTDKICLAAVKQCGLNIAFVKNQTDEICLAAMNQDGRALISVKTQTPEICLAAVKQNGVALEHVKTQTPEICLAAAQQDGYALQFVESQTEEICLAAIKETAHALQFVESQTEEMCLEAVKKDAITLKYVNKQNVKITLEAIKKNKNCYIHSKVKNFNDDVFLNSSASGVKFFMDDKFGHFYLKIQPKKQGNFLIKNILKKIKDKKIDKKDLYNDGLKLKIISETLPELDFNYILCLKRNSPELFENNLHISTAYEKIVLQNNLNTTDVNIKKNKTKKF